MKKQAVLLLFSIALFLSNCAKEDAATISPNDVVEKNNQSVIINFTATDVSDCGNWGWSVRDYLINNNSYKNKAKVICTYYYADNTSTRQLNTGIGYQWSSVIYLKPVPYFATNFEKTTFYLNTTNTDSAIDEAVNRHNSGPIEVSTKFNYHKDSNTYVVNTTTQFYEKISGSVWIGIYIIEDNVIAHQSGATGSNSTLHRNVLRTANNIFGAPLVNGDPIKTNYVYKKTATIDLDPSWKEKDLSIITILWKYDAGYYYFLNSNWK